MCIAIMKSENKKISKSTLQRCYDANPDGAGFMFANNKELTVKKVTLHSKNSTRSINHMRTNKYYYTFVLKRTVQLIKTIAIRSLLIVGLALFTMVLSLVTVMINNQIL